jgi:DNA primase
VTLAGDGEYAGLAPLGTAFTDAQADQLRPYLRPAQPGVIVATDADPAGRAAAQRAYWLLAARGDTPRHLSLPDGSDPAVILETSGPATLRATLEHPGSLHRVLVKDRLNQYATTRTGHDDPGAALDAVAAIIGAMPPAYWLGAVDDVAVQLGVPTAQVQLDVLDSAYRWTQDPIRQATRVPAGQSAATQQEAAAVRAGSVGEAVARLHPARRATRAAALARPAVGR